MSPFSSSFSSNYSPNHRASAVIKLGMQCKVSALECSAGMQPMARAPKQGQGAWHMLSVPLSVQDPSSSRRDYKNNRVIIYYSSPFGDRVAMFPPARLVGVGRSSHAHLLKATHACPLHTICNMQKLRLHRPSVSSRAFFTAGKTVFSGYP